MADQWASDQSQPPSAGGHRLALVAQRFGDPVVVGPALLASYAAGRIANVPGLSSASARIAAATFSAGLADLAIKFAVGRSRPDASPNDRWDLHPFSNFDASFPSGHTTVAFAAASALQAETSARWVPWVAYPTAAAVGWARIEENKHWASDVVAGAALGLWTGRKVDRFLARRAPLFDRATFLMHGSRRNYRVGFAAKF